MNIRKKSFLVVLLALCVVCSSKVYGVTKQCTDYDFVKGNNGCKKSYTNCVDSFGNSTDPDENGNCNDDSLPTYYTACTDEDYASGAHGCKKTYESNKSDNDNTVSDKEDVKWWGDAFNFLIGYKGESTLIGQDPITGENVYVGDIMTPLDSIIKLVRYVGNMMFVAVTVMLGVKYIWGSVESKASVKESLVTLCISAVVFYGWNTISALFFSDYSSLPFFVGKSFSRTATVIYSIIMYICNFLAIGGIIYVGVKYMMAGAEGKSQIKTKGVPMVLGIIMVYATITFLNLIVGLI